MSFSATSPACITVAIGIVDDAESVARSSMDWTNSKRLSPPTHLLSNESLPMSKEDDLVVLGTREVQRRFLDDEGKIELMGERGPLDKEVESESQSRSLSVCLRWDLFDIAIIRWRMVLLPVTKVLLPDYLCLPMVRAHAQVGKLLLDVCKILVFDGER